MPSRIATASILMSVASLAFAAPPAAEPSHSISNLSGRWAGSGTVEWKNGKSEPYKCVVTYFLGENGTRVRQNLRCQTNDASKLDIATQMQVANGAITGTWEERQYSMTGSVSGKVTANGYEAFAQNQFFNARFEIAMAGNCEQQITIRPNRDIALIKATLKKC
jgi:hypothetical protein